MVLADTMLDKAALNELLSKKWQGRLRCAKVSLICERHSRSASGGRARHRAGKPVQNGFVESFNGRMRDELLNETLFFGLDHARQKLATWTKDYNTLRPHSSIGYQTPAA